MIPGRKRSSNCSIDPLKAKFRKSIIKKSKSRIISSCETNSDLRKRFANFIKQPLAMRWAYFEFFYSNIDRPLLVPDNEFSLCLRDSFSKLKSRNLNKKEWNLIRSILGKPRRCSAAFFLEERNALNEKRQKLRLLQRREVFESRADEFRDMPSKISVPLNIGSRVITRLTSPTPGFYTGTVAAIDYSSNTYRVIFDNPSIGTLTAPDHELAGIETCMSYPKSDFFLKCRFWKYTRSPNSSNECPVEDENEDNIETTNLVSNGGTPAESEAVTLNATTDEVSSPTSGISNTSLEPIVRLVRALVNKSEALEVIRGINLKMERQNSFQKVQLDENDKQKYADAMLALLRHSAEINTHMEVVQKYHQQLIAEYQGSAPIKSAVAIKDKCIAEAEAMIQSTVSTQGRPAIENESLLDTITRLTSIVLQIRDFADGEGNLMELLGLDEALKEIKKNIHPENLRMFEDKVEVHVNHIKNDFSHHGIITSLADIRSPSPGVAENEKSHDISYHLDQSNTFSERQ